VKSRILRLQCLYFYDKTLAKVIIYFHRFPIQYFAVIYRIDGIKGKHFVLFHIKDIVR
jgi:hypothetical protein